MYPSYYQPMGYQNQGQPSYEASRLDQIYQQNPQFMPQQNYQAPPQQNPQIAQPSFIRVISVTSIDEVKSSIIQDPRQPQWYLNKADKCIHVKTINNDGLGVIETYKLDMPESAPEKPVPEYAELSTVAALMEHVELLEKRMEELTNGYATINKSTSVPQGSTGSSTNKSIAKSKSNDAANVQSESQLPTSDANVEG